mmetsp:Transcript_84936/g.140576  ORF Transcript_84936/g.140576 Transcript_84936/m.140576 type:complete len:236 (+) Transcript_84936:1-708(+)
MTLKLNICSLVGDLVCQIDADVAWKVFDLKEAIELADKFPKARQRLVIGTSTLRDKDTLAAALQDSLRDRQMCNSPPSCVSDDEDAFITITLIRLTELKVEWIRRVKQDGLALRLAPDSPRWDPVVTLAAVEQNGLALACAARELQRDRQIVRAAVEQNGLALMYADTWLRADEDIVSAAVKQNPSAKCCATSKRRLMQLMEPVSATRACASGIARSVDCGNQSSCSTLFPMKSR